MVIYGGSDGTGQAVAAPQADYFSRKDAFLVYITSVYHLVKEYAEL